ncbi:toxin-antitoxin system YwqK family antitoxin [Myxococcus sp. Y35]|uniref:toxin-antitoxin system YwqK family antitoxin n=1 Tax=Pseudomyxococcus flavus TaxID=3115648 RepID=UPI003CF995B1
MKLLLGVEAAFIGARLLQIVFPLQVPHILQAWVLWPALWDVPLDPRRVSPFTALIPWLLWSAVLLLWLEVLRRASGQRVTTRMQVIAVALLPGYPVVGLPRLMALMATVLGPLAAGFKAGARGMVTLHALVAAALVMEAWRDTPEWGVVVLCADGALLVAQFLTLRTVARALGERTAHPPDAEQGHGTSSPLPQEPPPPETGLDCPECPTPAPLRRDAGQPGHHCGHCEGDLLSPAERRLLQPLAGESAAMEATGRHVKCASCGESAATVVYRGAAVSPCASCGVVWMRAGVLHRLTQGQHGRPWTRPSATPAAPPPSLLSPRIGGLALVGVILVGTECMRVSEKSPCTPTTQHHRLARTDGWVLDRCANAEDTNEGISWLRDERGRLREETTWTQGARKGPYRRWDASGRLEVEGEYRADQPSGEWLHYARSGALVMRQSFAGGKLHGEVETLAEDGVLQELQNYEHGLLHGPYALYFPTGRKRVEGHYERGKRSGDWTTYDAAGQRVDATTWHEGQRSLVWMGGAKTQDAPDAQASEREVAEAASAPALSSPHDALYSGHALEWWAQRLRLLWPRRQDPEWAARYALTVHRANLNGLTVEETAAGPRVTRTPSPASAQADRRTP